MLRVVLLALALSSCAPIHSLTHPGQKQPLWAYVVDVTAMSVGACVGLDGWSRHDKTEEWTGFSVAAIAWLPYWAIETR